MAEIRIRKRRRLRNKDIQALSIEIKEKVGREHFTVGDAVDKASSTDLDVIFVEGKIMALIIDGEAFPSIRGILRYGAESGFVTVDMGAIPYVANGADIMAPGVVDADPDVSEGELVWVRDVENDQPLAVGRALVPGPAMSGSSSGKVVETIHHVGDKIWKYDEE